jgi:hypothetical protein
VQAKIVRYLRPHPRGEPEPDLKAPEPDGSPRLARDRGAAGPLYRGEITSRWNGEVIRVQNDALRIVDDATC